MKAMDLELRRTVEARIARARGLLQARGWQALWVGASTNLRYLSGVVEKPSERLFGAFIPLEGDPFMLVPRLYHDEMADLSAIADVKSWSDEEGMAAALRRACPLEPGSTLAIDPLLQASFVFLFQEQLSGVRLVSAGDLLGELRLRKDDYEKDCLRRVAGLADAVMSEVTRASLVGRTERQVAERIEQLFRELGSEGVSFSPIVSAGPNAAYPHHQPDDTVIAEGQGVVLDFGGVYRGYASDITRTVFMGQPPAELRRIYSVVREAQQLAVERLRPGMAASAADAVAREHIAEAGYGPAFVHRLGHGIGLDVHEPPYLVEGNAARLDPGCAFSVEPGIYVPGLGGVRIEDIVFMNADGAERLNSVSRELLGL